MLGAAWCGMLIIQITSGQNLAVSDSPSLGDHGLGNVSSCIDQSGSAAYERPENVDMMVSMESNRSVQENSRTQCDQYMTTEECLDMENETFTHSNCTNGVPRTQEPDNKTKEELPLSYYVGYTDKDNYLANWYAAYVIDPLIGIPGTLGNIASFVVMIKSGLQKPSNIIILGLAVADFFALLCNINVAQFLLYGPRKVPAEYLVWNLPYLPFMIVWSIDTFLITMAEYGSTMSTMLTIVIVIERCLAVYVPLKFTQIVTPRRAWVTLVSVTLFWFPWNMILAFTYTPYHAYDSYYDTYIGWHEVSDNLATRIAELLYIDAITHLTHTIPFVLVVVGTIAIAIKVRLTTKKRMKLATDQKQRSTSRTTKTLLLVCVVYIALQLSYMVEYIPALSGRMAPFTITKLVYYQIRRSLLHINSAVNFYIYVFYNPKFRTVFIETFCPVCLRKAKK